MASRIDYEFQTEAVDELSSYILDDLDSTKKRDDTTNIIFEAPIAAGKTIMSEMTMDTVAETMEDLSNSVGPISFVFLTKSKGNLDTQSLSALRSYGSEHVTFHSLDEFVTLVGAEGRIPTSSCVVLGWDSIDKRNNRHMTLGETPTFRSVMEEHRDDTKRILFIDEAHAHLTPKWDKIVELIHPYSIVLVTATVPSEDRFARSFRRVRVPAEDVVAAGKIKQQVIVNDGVDDLPIDSVLSSYSWSNLMDMGGKMQEFLQMEYRKVGMDVTPLVVIQLPNDSTKASVEAGHVDRAREILTKELDVPDEDIAVWTSGEHTVTSTALATSTHRFLITKLAVAEGWDCPRAQILVKLRVPSKSETLDPQTLGRIYRTTDPREWLRNDGYRENVWLNSAYVYTDSPSYDPQLGGLSIKDKSRANPMTDGAKETLGKVRLIRIVAGSKQVVAGRGQKITNAVKAMLNRHFPYAYRDVQGQGVAIWRYDRTGTEVARGHSEVVDMYDDIDALGHHSIGQALRSLSDDEIQDAIRLRIRTERRIKKHATPIINGIEQHAKQNLCVDESMLFTENLAEAFSLNYSYDKTLQDRMNDLCWAINDNWLEFVDEVNAILEKESKQEHDMVWDGTDKARPMWSPPAVELLTGDGHDPYDGYAYERMPSYDSKTEGRVAKRVIAKRMDVWMKNNTKTASSFCIVWTDKTGFRHNFFPDFIGIKGRTLYILERKGDKTDKQDFAISPEEDKKKAKAIWEWMTSQRKALSIVASEGIDDIVFGISKSIKGTEMVYQGDGTDYENEGSSNWKKLDDILGK